MSSTLLETSVTWEDVELALQKSLGTTAKFGDNKKVTNFGHMKGFMSRIALIEPDWTGVELPERFIVKISSALGVKDLFDVISFLKPDANSAEPSESNINIEQVIRLYHNREVETYELIAREANPNLRTIRTFASRSYSDEDSAQGFLICEFVPDVHSIPLFGSISYKNLIPVVDSAGAFSAMGERMAADEKKKMGGENRLEEVINTFFPPNSFPKIQNLLIEALGENPSIQKVMTIIDVICGPQGILKNYSKVSGFLGHSAVLMHSDLWSANMLFTKGSQDHLEFKAIIDFQDTSFGGAGIDVASLAVCCMSKEDRAAHKADLLQRYYNSFKANLHGAPVPYTFQQLQDSYDLCFVPLSLQILPIIWSLAKHNGSEQALELARGKMSGLLEDLIEIQEANVKKFPEFFRI